MRRRNPIFWTCLKEKCANSCCGPKFSDKNVRGIWDVPHELIPLLFEEMSEIVSRFGPGPIMRHADGMFYIRLKKDGSCPFWRDGICNIQDMKPAICRAYPLMDLDSSIGVVMDSRCPGFVEAERQAVVLDHHTYATMIGGLIEIQEYRIQRLRLELINLPYSADLKRNDISGLRMACS